MSESSSTNNVISLKTVINRRKAKEERQRLKEQKEKSTRIRRFAVEIAKHIPDDAIGYCTLYLKKPEEDADISWGLAYEFMDYRDYVAFPQIFHHIWFRNLAMGDSSDE